MNKYAGRATGAGTGFTGAGGVVAGAFMAWSEGAAWVCFVVDVEPATGAASEEAHASNGEPSSSSEASR
jgi:hypothetical protein